MSSPYVTLGNRPLDQWKVTELKEELKRRKLTTKGLKEDLVKRLNEAVRSECENSEESADNDPSDTTQSELPFEEKIAESVSANPKDFMDMQTSMVKTADHLPEIDDRRGKLVKDRDVEADLVHGTKADRSEGELVGQTYLLETTPVAGDQAVEADLVQETKVTGLEGEHVGQIAVLEEATVAVDDNVESVGHLHGKEINEDGDSTAGINSDGLKTSEEDPKLENSYPNTQLPDINESSTLQAPPSDPRLQDNETHNEAMDSTCRLENDDSNCLQPDPSVQPLKYQVSEVDPDSGFQVISDSLSTESVSIIEKNELKVDVITENVKLELDVKHEVVQPSFRSGIPVGDDSHSLSTEEPLEKKEIKEFNDKKDIEEPLEKIDVDEPLDQKKYMEVTIGSSRTENVDGLKNADSDDFGPPEKLTLDRSSGDDSMEEDMSETKQIDSKSNANKTVGGVEKFEKTVVKEEDQVDVIAHDKPIEMKAANSQNERDSGPSSVKRKFHDKEAIGNDDTLKRPRRWNIESSKGSHAQSGNFATSTPENLSEPTFKHSSGADTAANEEAAKERIVPPSVKPPSNSLRIDQFVRPFTLKAVQELLGKTGTVSSFWMDHIKTHCYVSYSSVEEAVETRKAVYNLQWPPNGGRLLVAEFVDPQEAKIRVEATPASPATPSSNVAPTTFSASQPQPSQRHQVPRQQQLPPPPLPPPPPLANPPVTLEHSHPVRERLHRDQPLPVRDRLNLPPPPPLPEKVEPPIVTLDDLFRKTKATPRIYYLPLSDEQVAGKLMTQRKNVN